MKIDRRLIFNFDWTLMTLITIILGMGVLNLYSAGHGLSGEPHLKQMRWVVLGIGVMVLAFAFDYRWIARYAYVIHALAVVLLIAVFAVGSVTKGSQRWINVGGFTMQPSELVKITLIFALAKYFNDHRFENRVGIRELAVPFLIVLVPFVLVLKQPDLGTALMLMILFGSMVLFIGIRWRTLAGLVALVVFAIVARRAWVLLAVPVLAAMGPLVLPAPMLASTMPGHIDVTGYLVTGIGASASAAHAWAEIAVPDLGWVGFDAANGQSPTDHYVRIAAGLDAAAVAPVRGFRRGGAGTEQMTVEVRVEIAQQ